MTLSTLLSALTPLGALAAIVAAILLLGRGFRASHWARPGPSGRLLVVKDSVALDTRRRLHLVQLGGRSVVLLTGGERDLVVGWQEETPPS